jgi:hypothetical protein
MQPTGYIWDIDGVLAESEIRSQYEEEMAKGDFTWFENRISHFRAHRWAVESIRCMNTDHTIIFVTARDEKYRAATVSWIEKNVGIRNFKLIMRIGDGADHDIKMKAYKEKIEGRYRILAAFDDKKECIDMWRSLNIVALHNKDVDAK